MLATVYRDGTFSSVCCLLGHYVAIACEPECIVGLDVSAPTQLRRGHSRGYHDLLSIFHGQFTQREWRHIQDAGDNAESVFRLHWGLKEAVVKARGDGIVFNLGRIDFDFVDDSMILTSLRENASACPRSSISSNAGVSSSQSSSLLATCTEEASLDPTLARATTDSHVSSSIPIASMPVTCSTSSNEDHNPVRALLRIDGVLQTCWRLWSVKVGDHWFSVARTSPRSVLDGVGEFLASMWKRDYTDAEWGTAADVPFPDFVFMSVRDLIPKERLEEYDNVARKPE